MGGPPLFRGVPTSPPPHGGPPLLGGGPHYDPSPPVLGAPLRLVLGGGSPHFLGEVEGCPPFLGVSPFPGGVPRVLGVTSFPDPPPPPFFGVLPNSWSGGRGGIPIFGVSLFPAPPKCVFMALRPRRWGWPLPPRSPAHIGAPPTRSPAPFIGTRPPRGATPTTKATPPRTAAPPNFQRPRPHF